jgi:hypothetical protein
VRFRHQSFLPLSASDAMMGRGLEGQSFAGSPWQVIAMVRLHGMNQFTASSN